jgi:hypothetical protein
MEFGVNFKFTLTDALKSLDSLKGVFLYLGNIQCLDTSISLDYSDHFLPFVLDTFNVLVESHYA